MEPFVQLVVMWCGVLFAVFAARKTKLTPVLFFLFVGAVLVNTGLLPEQTHPFIGGLADIGIVVIMFAIGFEENTANFLYGVKRSWGIALFGAIGPFVTAYAVADYFWGDTSVSLMCGLAMTATAVSLTLVSLRGEGLQTTRAATGIMTSAVLDDIGSLAMVAILVPFATGEAPGNASEVGWIISKAILFFMAVAVLGVWVFPEEREGLLSNVRFLRRFGIRRLFGFSKGEHITLMVLALAVVVGLAAHALGFHPAVGAYMAGLILREEYFQFTSDPETNHYQKVKFAIDDIAFSWIGPIFFIDLGTKIVFDPAMVIRLLPEIIAFTVGLFVVQILSAGLAARYTGHFNWRESVLIGFGMLGRAELAFVVLDIAYIEHHILTEEMFVALMATAFGLNVSVPVTITLWKPYFLGEKRLFQD
ncbi:MAG: cation:proton antiporter [Rhodobiaceae bacterium]|nr:cation:proton antiporter [Rhodobiaceae bacterium]